MVATETALSPAARRLLARMVKSGFAFDIGRKAGATLAAAQELVGAGLLISEPWYNGETRFTLTTK